MERIAMAKKIMSLKKTYDLTDYQYVGLLNLMHDKMSDFTENARCCEDMLFETYVRLIKNLDLSKWIGTKINKDFLTSLSHTEANYNKIINSIEQFDLGDDPSDIFKLYIHIYELNNEVVVPEFSAISALKEMHDDTVNSLTSG
tara:strand:- start:28 stop:459 length:432 start_codon:yes stop_codon:yes gene_type:complete